MCLFYLCNYCYCNFFFQIHHLEPSLAVICLHDLIRLAFPDSVLGLLAEDGV